MARLSAFSHPVPKLPYKHSLLASAYRLDPADFDGERWEAGITFEPDSCKEVAAWDTSCNASLSNTKNADFSEPGVQIARPITVYSSFTCQIGPSFLEEGRDRAMSILMNGVSKELEYELWTGSSGYSNVNLVNNTPTVTGSSASATGGIINPGGPATIGYSLVSLGQAASNCGTGARGMIHAPAMLVEAWAAAYYLDEIPNPQAPDDRSRDLLVTRGRGDIVVVEAGATGTGPGGIVPAAGTAYAYWSPMVGVILGEPYFASEKPVEILDRAKNTGIYLAEVSVGYILPPCCLFAVLVDVASALT